MRGFISLILALALIPFSAPPAVAGFTLASASSQYLSLASSAVSDEPCTMAIWLRPDDTSTIGVVMSLSTSGGTARLQIGANVTGAKLSAQSINAAGGEGKATTTASMTAATWHHACAVFSAANSRTIYLDGANGVTETTSITSSGWNRTLVGARLSAGSAGAYFKGQVAEAAVWNVALGAAEIAALAKGFSPALIRPSALVFYAPLVRELSDLKSGTALTNNNTATVSAHTRVIGR